MGEHIAKVIKVIDLLTIQNLNIPHYQRPYKWTKEKRQELWYDILTQYDKTKDVIGQKNSGVNWQESRRTIWGRLCLPDHRK